MALITFSEIIRLVVMTVGLGYICMGFIKRPRTELDLLYPKGFNWEDFKFAIMITAPAVILHEFGHKFMAMLMGLQAEFFVSYFGLGLGVFLRIIGSPFIIFVPGFVRISAIATPLQTAITAFMGPFVNLSLFLIAGFILSRAKKLTQTQAMFLYLTKQINLFLFLFNMIPIPPFDGFHVVSGLFNAVI